MRSRNELLGGGGQVESFLSDLAVNGHVSASTQNHLTSVTLTLNGCRQIVKGMYHWPRMAALCAALSLFHVASLNAAEFHVALNGKDANPGTKAKPFSSLERAR